MRFRDARVPAALATLAAIAVLGVALAALPRQPVPAGEAARVDEAFRRGVAMLQARRYDVAMAAFHDVLELAPGMPEAHVNMGYAMLGLQRPAEARDFFRAASALRPAQVNAYYGLALAAEATGDRATALAAMRTYAHLAAAGDPHLAKAQAAIRHWEARPAVASFGKAIPTNGSTRPREAGKAADPGAAPSQ